MRIAITGATGLVGRAVCRRLLGRADHVFALTRDPGRAAKALPSGANPVRWAVGDTAATAQAINGCDAVVNLAGEPILGRRWNDKFKERLRESRVEGTRTVVEAMRRAKKPPRVLVNASATGYYGPHGREELTEESKPGADFLAQLCIEWEAEARAAAQAGARVVILRIGIVLTPEGGALKKMLRPIKAFVGGRIGDGRQGMSFIHISDLAGLIVHAIDEQALSGPANAVAPTPLSNADFTKAVARAAKRPAWLPVPRFALRLLMGEMGDVLTTGQFVLPRRALDAGFEFRYPTADEALADLLRG